MFVFKSGLKPDSFHFSCTYQINYLTFIFLKTTTCNCMLNLTKQRKLFDHMGRCGPMEKASDFKSENAEFESPHGLSAVFFGVVC